MAGSRMEQIADLMIVSPEETPEGELLLSIVISEAKYVDEANLAKKRKESQKQLRDTVRRIHEALFGNPDRLDRELWLARLADLVLDGVQFAAGQSINLGKWRHAMRAIAIETVPGSGCTEMMFKPCVVKNSERRLFTCSTVMCLLPANLSSAAFGVIFDSSNLACR